MNLESFGTPPEAVGFKSRLREKVKRLGLKVGNVIFPGDEWDKKTDELNVAGEFFVDMGECVGSKDCYLAAPGMFGAVRADTTYYGRKVDIKAYVARQPTTLQQLSEAIHAQIMCPMDAIRTNGTGAYHGWKLPHEVDKPQNPESLSEE